MQTPPPALNLLSIFLMIAAIYVLVKSPKKLQTLGRMALAFVVTVLLITISVALFFRRGNPQAWGQLAGRVGLLAAVITGYGNVRALRRAGVAPQKLPSQV